MSRNIAILSKTESRDTLTSSPGSSPLSIPGLGKAVSTSGEYTELIRKLFGAPAAVALVGSDIGDSDRGASQIANNLASELAIGGKRVLVVVARRLLRMNPIVVPCELDLMPGNTPLVWVWPSPASQKIELSRSRDVSHAGNWLDSLRRNFDAILLDCPNQEGTPGVTDVASMADAAILAVKAGCTSKRQLLQDQRALQLRGALVAGCILIQGS